MAGKTTLIKAIGLNVLIGNNIGLCFAKNACIPNVQVRTCIEPKQSLQTGLSTYSAEITRLKTLLKKLDSGDFFILIDEILKGTNTIERIAAASAILDEFAKKALSGTK